MSAWYIFNTMGFYPVNPASAEYLIGTPYFEHMSIQFPQSNHRLELRANNPQGNVYVAGVTVDDVELDMPVLTHKQLLRSHDINYSLKNTPQSWGANKL